MRDDEDEGTPLDDADVLPRTNTGAVGRAAVKGVHRGLHHHRVGGGHPRHDPDASAHLLHTVGTLAGDVGDTAQH